MSLKIYLPHESLAIALGAEEIAAAITSEAKARQLDIELVRTGSRGAAWAEPLLEVDTKTGRILYANISVEDIPSLFEAGFLNGAPHEKCIGGLKKIPWLAKQTRQTFSRCGIADPLSLDDYQAHEGFAGLTKAFEMTHDTIVQSVTKSGLRGRGGAGFPTGIKWRTVAQAKAKQKYIICNADEGDSGTFADRLIIEGDPFLLLEGMMIAGYAAGATKGVIYLRSEYPLAAQILTQALGMAREAGWLGKDIKGSGFTFDIELFIAAGSYVCGEETALLESLEGKRGQVRSKPPLPALEGLYGCPSVINNVLTLCAVPDILAHGPEKYQDLGIGKSRGTTAFQLGGNVKYGGLIEVPFGISLRELVEDFGGGTKSGLPLRAVQIGGPLGVYLPSHLLDIKMDYETLSASGAALGHGGIIVFDESVDLLKQAKYAFEFCAHESCGKCTPCRIGAVRGTEVMGAIGRGENVQQNLKLIADLCEIMADGSLCAMGGLTPMPVRSALRHFAEDFTGKGAGQ